MRIGQNLRFVRLIVSLCVYGAVVVTITSDRNKGYADTCYERNKCRTPTGFPRPRETTLPTVICSYSLQVVLPQLRATVSWQRFLASMVAWPPHSASEERRREEQRSVPRRFRLRGDPRPE